MIAFKTLYCDHASLGRSLYSENIFLAFKLSHKNGMKMNSSVKSKGAN